MPGAVDTFARGINNTAEIVGSFDNGSGPGALRHGFLDIGGVLTTLDVPGATQTEAYGINDAGQIVGTFGDSTGTHGFLATPVPGRICVW